MITKEHILSEIFRTANENNGKALGVQRFENETGIKQSDWYGKYWSRWGDALEEAGFTANKLNDAYDINHIREKYAFLVRELGHIPVIGEIRMKATNDKSFPSHTVFTRLGKKDQLIENVANYCKEKNEWNDVYKILSKHKPKDAKNTQPDQEEVNYKDGFVYLIKSGRYYKIGMTNDLHRRTREISIELPERSETIHSITTDDPSGIEAYWHKRFSSKRVNGEWFSLTPSDIKAFRRRKFM